MIVVDASVLAPALIDDGSVGDAVRARLAGEPLLAPELIDLEIASILRKMVRGGTPVRRAELAFRDLFDLSLPRIPHRRLIDRCFQLRDNLTPYDAAYVATAEAFGATLLTADGPLSRAPGVDCKIELYGSAG